MYNSKYQKDYYQKHKQEKIDYAKKWRNKNKSLRKIKDKNYRNRQLTNQEMQNFYSIINSIKSPKCWIWNHSLVHGYGLFMGKSAHRVSYELYKGSIPKNMVVMHTCDNPSCVNPEHLEIGTQSENIADMIKKGRQSKGESKPTAKLTEKQVLEIRAKFKPRKYTYEMLSKEYGLAVRNICKIIARESWKHI